MGKIQSRASSASYSGCHASSRSLTPGHVALAPRGAFGRLAVVGLLLLGQVQERLEARRRFGQRALDADHVAQDQRHDALRVAAVAVRGRGAAAAVAPDLRQPLRRLDRFRAAHDRREEAVEHLEVHAVFGHRVGREEALEFVELGVGKGFVQGAGFGHGAIISPRPVSATACARFSANANTSTAPAWCSAASGSGTTMHERERCRARSARASIASSRWAPIRARARSPRRAAHPPPQDRHRDREQPREQRDGRTARSPCCRRNSSTTARAAASRAARRGRSSAGTCCTRSPHGCPRRSRRSAP